MIALVLSSLHCADCLKAFILTMTARMHKYSLDLRPSVFSLILLWCSLYIYSLGREYFCGHGDNKWAGRYNSIWHTCHVEDMGSMGVAKD